MSGPAGQRSRSSSHCTYENRVEIGRDSKGQGQQDSTCTCDNRVKIERDSEGLAGQMSSSSSPGTCDNRV